MSTAAVLAAAGCGGDDGGGSAAAPAAGGEGTNTTQGAKAVDVAAMQGAKGNVNFCTGKDTTGAKAAAVKDFKREAPELTVKLVEFPEGADAQRQQFIQRQQAKSADCDIFYSDVIWTAEFASQKWLLDMTPYVKQRAKEFIPSTLETTRFENKFWGVPNKTNAGFLFYRTDQVDKAPATWQAVYADAAKEDGVVYQGAAYEGLTVNFLELAFAAGGEVLSKDGTKATIDSPENLKALQFMVDGVKSKAAPQAVTTYMEEPARRAFEAGRATYMRNWPYAYGLGKKSKVGDDFDIVPYPPFEGGKRASILGGGNFVISAYSKNPGGSLKLIEFLTGPEIQLQDAAEFSEPPTLIETYDDPKIRKGLPFAADLKQAVEQGRARPVSPVYPQISQAIYKNVNAALSGKVTPQQALKSAQADMEKALATF